MSLAPILPIDDPARAVTIFVPVQSASHAGATGNAGAGADGRHEGVNQAAILPLDDDSVMWILLAGGIALSCIVIRRKRRMPSVTS